MHKNVLVVVPTYRPSAATVRLVETLASSAAVVVSDDASPSTSDGILRAIASLPDVHLVRHERNRGIARGLNDGLTLAQQSQRRWLLTVDQDSVIPNNYLELLQAAAEERASRGAAIGAIGAGEIRELSGVLRYPVTQSDHGPITEELIQTGTLWSVSALAEIGGFDESLGMDAVDAAACLALRKRNYAICVAEGLTLSHVIGSARTITLMGRTIMITGHSPERRSTMIHNRLRLFRAEFQESPRHALRTLRRVAVNHGLGLFLESDRWSKFQGSVRGLRGFGDR